jgi:PilZ domain
MLEDRRRSQRHAVSGRARIQTLAGTVAGTCLIADISDGGARLVAEGLQVPEEFLLCFEDIEDGSRECRVVWRLDDEIGIEFLDAEEDGFALRVVR